MSFSTAPYSVGRAWLVSLVGLVSCIVLSFIYAAIAPSMNLLMEYFQMGEASAGWLITGCYLVSVVLALPGGVLVDKFGPLKVGLVGLAFSLVGTVAGLFVTDYVSLMVTRIVQGVGPALLAIAVPTVMSAWFSSEKRGPIMTLFSLWQSIGIFIVTYAATFLLVQSDLASWRNLWVFTIAFIVVAIVLYAAFIRMPSERQDIDETDGEVAESGSSLKGFASVATWFLALTFAAWAVIADTLVNFTPLYCIEQLGMDAAAANGNASLISMGMIIGGLIMVPVLAKVQKLSARLFFLIAGEVILVVLAFFMFKYTADIAVVYLMAIGILMMIIPSICCTIAPDTALKPAYLGVTLGIFAMAQNLGLGAAITGAFLETVGWSNMFIETTVFGVVLIVATLVIMVTMKRRAASKA